MTESQVTQALNQGKSDQAIELARSLPAGMKRTRLLVACCIKRGRAEDIDEAIVLLELWHREKPGDGEAIQRLLEVSLYEQRIQDALRWLDKLKICSGSSIHPGYYQAVIDLLQGQPKEALSRLLAFQPQPSSQDHLQDSMNKVTAAMQLNDIAAGHYPGSQGPNLTSMLEHHVEQKLLRQALEGWKLSHSKRQNRAETSVLNSEEIRQISNGWFNLGCYAMADFNSQSECVEDFGQAFRLNPGHVPARVNQLFMLNYSTRVSSEEIFTHHRRTGDWLGSQTNGSTDFSDRKNPDKVIRIGYLSSDFRRHSVAHFLLPVLRHHDGSRFEVVLYHNHKVEDDYTKKFRDLCDHFYPVSQLDDDALHRRLLNDRIDLLIDLNGLTGNHRMSMLARRSAPIQLNWLGYPNTTGLASMDYRIVDRCTDPPEYAPGRMVETPLYMPRIFSVYQAPGDLPQTVIAPSEKGGTITFGSFNYLPKLNPDLLEDWAKILQRVDSSRLLIKNMSLTYKAPRERIADMFRSHGIDRSRLCFAGKTGSMREHMAHYQSVDICLDSYPYNGTTTTCDSLIMGVPVISRYGDDHRSRVGLSQLSAIGMDYLASSTRNGYIEAAVNLALNPDQLSAARSGLRRRMQSSPLMDGKGFTRELEQALLEVWQSWCKEDQVE